MARSRISIFGLLAAGLVCFWSSDASAQITVQIPTVGFFNVNTVVSVPDGGTMYLGGVKRSAQGRTTRGTPLLGSLPGIGRGFKNTAIGSDNGASGSSVKVQIIVMSELEKEVMAEAERQAALRRAHDPNGTVENQKKADFITRNIGRNKNR